MVYTTDSNNNVMPGSISLPNGNPTAGGAAVAYTGTSSMLFKGNYTYTVTATVLTGGMNVTTKSTGKFTVP